MSISSGGKVTVKISILGCRHLASRTSDMTSLDQNNFYVTLLSNALREIYDQNTHADFTVKLAQPIDLGTTSKWEVGVSEIWCSSSPEGARPVLRYCNVISRQFLGISTVRCIGCFGYNQTQCISTSFGKCNTCRWSSADFRAFESISWRPKFCTSPLRTALYPQEWFFIFASITSGRRSIKPWRRHP